MVPIAIVAVPMASDAATAIVGLRIESLLGSNLLMVCLSVRPLLPLKTRPGAREIYSRAAFSI